MAEPKKLRRSVDDRVLAGVASGLGKYFGVDPMVVLELLLCWNRVRCRPPLPEDEVSRTVESITRLHQREEQQRGA